MLKNQNDTSRIDNRNPGAGECAACGKTDIYAKGLCESCYKAQWYQEKKMNTPPNPVKKSMGRPPISGEKATECSACKDKRVYARGLCYKCYKRAYQQGNITSDGVDAAYQRPRTTDPITGDKKVCSYCGLSPAYAGGLCRRCHARAKRNGGDPAYKTAGPARVMRCRQLLKQQHGPQADR